MFIRKRLNISDTKTPPYFHVTFNSIMKMRHAQRKCSSLTPMVGRRMSLVRIKTRIQYPTDFDRMNGRKTILDPICRFLDPV